MDNSAILLKLNIKPGDIVVEAGTEYEFQCRENGGFCLTVESQEFAPMREDCRKNTLIVGANAF